MLRTLKDEDDFVRLLCFSVWFFWTKPGTWQTDVCGSEFKAAAPNSAEEVRKKKPVPTDPLTVVLEGSILFILLYGLHTRAVVNFASSCLGDADFDPGVSGNEDVPIGSGDWWSVERTSHSCYQEPGTVGWQPQLDVPEDVHWRSWSR